jgi:lysophospholipase L1-like esterase
VAHDGSPGHRHAGRRVALILALVATLLTVLPPSSAAAPSLSPQSSVLSPSGIGIGELYLALGDSLGVGLLSSLPETRGYVAQFHALLQQRAGRGIQLDNLSVSGETTRSMIANGQLDAALRTIAAAQANGWRVSPITIDIGGNDMLALRDKTDAAREAGLADFRANVAAIFDRVAAAITRDGARTSDILTMTVYNPYAGDPAVARSLAWWAERFNAALAEEAGWRGIAVAPVYERFRGQEQALTFVPLDFHPNNRGHRAIAETFWRAAGYDTAAPTMEVLEPSGERLARTVPTIKVRASDDIGVARVELLLDDQPLPAPLYQPALDLFVGYWDGRAAPPGPHRLTVVATDAAGNATRRDLTLAR